MNQKGVKRVLMMNKDSKYAAKTELRKTTFNAFKPDGRIRPQSFLSLTENMVERSSGPDTFIYEFKNLKTKS